MATRSVFERGCSAEKTPTGMAISIHRMAPPNTSDAVTGAALEHRRVDRLAVGEGVAEAVVDDEPLEEEAVLVPDRPVCPR